jgi:diguanylate cyclase (GGDEF)-like protein
MSSLDSSDELKRLDELRSYAVLDTEAEQAYDDVVRLASFICNTPIALISLIDEDRQWFKAKVGLNDMETPRGQAFCSHAINHPDAIMEVRDALLDTRFSGNPLVTGEAGVRFYAGAPLITASGAALGTVCVIDRVPRQLTDAQTEALKALSRQVVQLLALRRANAELALLSRAHASRQRELEAVQLELQQLNIELSRQTQTDALTGLNNRRAFDSVLGYEVERTVRAQSTLALLMVDVDHFKAYNDQFGHVAGDEALKAIAVAIKSQARAYDHVARYGGEEFAVVLPDAGPMEMQAVAERIRMAVNALTSLHRPVTVSVGAALCDGTRSAQNLVDRADQALYQAKQDGRNRVHIASDRQR